MDFVVFGDQTSNITNPGEDIETVDQRAHGKMKQQLELIAPLELKVSEEVCDLYVMTQRPSIVRLDSVFGKALRSSLKSCRRRINRFIRRYVRDLQHTGEVRENDIQIFDEYLAARRVGTNHEDHVKRLTGAQASEDEEDSSGASES